MRRSRLTAALVLLIAIATYVATLPPRTRVLPALPQGAPVKGTIHVHTRRSDGTGTVDEVAAAAARAGLNFVILTDHGDATRKPDRPVYLHGVLVIDAVEVSTSAGHVVAIGLGQAPYPLGGAPRDVVEDIQRLGGFAIVAHPDSPKPDLRWDGWQTPFDGIEWLNGDSEWRDESRWSLVRALLAYPLRPREALTMLFNRPDVTLRHWDALTTMRHVVAVAAPDAHARIGFRSLGELYDRTALRLPSYESMFRTMSSVLPQVTLSRDAAADAAAVITAIREGHVYSVLDGVGGPSTLLFTASSGGGTVEAGSDLPLSGPVTLHIGGQLPADATTVIVKDGVAVRMVSGVAGDVEMPALPATYRVEVRLPGAPGRGNLPWIVSNPIYVGRQAGVSPAAAPSAVSKSSVLYANAETFDARVEHSDMSAADIKVIRDVPGRQLLFRYALGGKMSASPYAAVVMPAREVSPYDRVTFIAHADHPLRLAVQLRTLSGSDERWQRSIYLDETARPITVLFSEMMPIGGASGRPRPSDVDALLFVVDIVNTMLGTNGQVWIDDITFAK